MAAGDTSQTTPIQITYACFFVILYTLHTSNFDSCKSITVLINNVNHSIANYVLGTFLGISQLKVHGTHMACVIASGDYKSKKMIRQKSIN